MENNLKSKVEKLNGKSKTIKEGVDLQTMEFRTLKEFVGQRIRIDGFFFSNSKYGEQVSLVGGGYKINMPKWAVEKFKQLSEDEELMAAMFDGLLYIDNIIEKNTTNGTTTLFKFNI